MQSFTAADLDRLAEGRPVGSELFRAIFADAEAVGELARLLQARDLLEPPGPEALPPDTIADMNVSWDELAAYGECKPLPPERHAAVERFLGTHFPEALRDPADSDTIESCADQDTEFPLPPHRPPGTESKEA
jgi:hypothetical protein